MVQLNPFNVIMLVYVTFSALNLSTSPITSEEREMAHKIESMLKEMRDERYEMEVEEPLDYENDNDIPTAEQFELGDEEEEGELLDANPKVICTTDERIPYKYKKNAVEFWKSSTTRPRTLEGVKRRFRKVYSLRQLRRWEIQVNQGGSRFEKLKQISEYTLNNFHTALENRIIDHDVDLARWAIRAQENLNVPGFTASSRWIRKFKIIHNIVSRKITKFIKKTSIMSNVDFEEKCNTFIENVKYQIIEYGVENIYNSDQSGFQLELHAGHTLAYKGTKKIESAVQSVSATTHSYTIQPTVSADGRLLSPLFIVLKEVSGTFGPKVQETMFKAPNIFVTASKSGKLTAHYFKIWLQGVFFPNVGPKSVLLLDSWTGHCPNIIQESKPESTEDIILLTIPAGTTGKIQPLDVYGFRLWKNFIRHFSDTVMLLGLEINLHARNTILKLQSLTHNQFLSPKFRNLLKYGIKHGIKAGT
ncbi:uncharacterized protein [Linepithema humile]|uniref:uncharacterized protein isoform X1 n=1 Tax=Linepithema humile TaxID=83485 RepID=UPI00351F5ED7